MLGKLLDTEFEELDLGWREESILGQQALEFICSRYKRIEENLSENKRYKHNLWKGHDYLTTYLFE